MSRLTRYINFLSLLTAQERQSNTSLFLTDQFKTAQEIYCTALLIRSLCRQKGLPLDIGQLIIKDVDVGVKIYASFVCEACRNHYYGNPRCAARSASGTINKFCGFVCADSYRIRRWTGGFLVAPARRITAYYPIITPSASLSVPSTAEQEVPRDDS